MEIWWTGKTHEKYLDIGIQEYLKRIRFFHKVELREFKESKSIKDPVKMVAYEEENLKKALKKSPYYVILLDENGLSMRSLEFAKWLEPFNNNSSRKLCFIIGGAYGFSNSFKQQADSLLSMSKMTFSHQLVRLVFVEQLYRSISIQNNLPYHHE